MPSKWIAEEAFGRQFLIMQVSESDPRATKKKPPFDSDRHWTKVLVDDIDKRVVDRRADGNLRRRLVDPMTRRPHGGFRGTVHVPQVRTREVKAGRASEAGLRRHRVP